MSEATVKQETKWKLEAEAEFQNAQKEHWAKRLGRWVFRNILLVALGTLIGLVVGAGWNLLSVRQQNRETRSEILFEALHRIRQVHAIYGEISEKDPEQALEVLNRHEKYISDPLTTPIFGGDPKLKHYPDRILVAKFRLAGGDEKMANRLKEILQQEWVALDQLRVQLKFAVANQQPFKPALIRYCGESFRRIRKSETELFDHPDLKIIIDLDEDDDEVIKN